MGTSSGLNCENNLQGKKVCSNEFLRTLKCFFNKEIQFAIFFTFSSVDYTFSFFENLQNLVQQKSYPKCNLLFQSEAKCNAIDMNINIFSCNKTHFQKKGFALNLVLRVTVFGHISFTILNLKSYFIHFFTLNIGSLSLSQPDFFGFNYTPINFQVLVRPVAVMGSMRL